MMLELNVLEAGDRWVGLAGSAGLAWVPFPLLDGSLGVDLAGDRAGDAAVVLGLAGDVVDDVRVLAGEATLVRGLFLLPTDIFLALRSSESCLLTRGLSTELDLDGGL